MNKIEQINPHTIYPVSIAIISAILFGAAVPASKTLLRSISPFHLAGLLYLGAAIAACPTVIKKTGRSLPWQIGRRNRLLLLGAVIIGGVLAPVFLLLGLKLASAASVSMWLPLELVTTAVLGTILFHDQLGWSGWLGLSGVVLAGLILGIYDNYAGVQAGLLVALACLCWGFDNNFTALIDEITPSQATFWKGLIAGSVNLSLGAISQGYKISLVATSEALAVGIFSYGFSIMLYITAVQSIGATRGQMFFASGPLWGVLLSAIFLGEKITIVQAIAAALLSISLILIFVDKHGHPHFHDLILHKHSHRHDDAHHNHTHEDSVARGHHTHIHKHEPTKHSHSHLPDLHHRHKH